MPTLLDNLLFQNTSGYLFFKQKMLCFAGIPCSLQVTRNAMILHHADKKADTLALTFLIASLVLTVCDRKNFVYYSSIRHDRYLSHPKKVTVFYSPISALLSKCQRTQRYSKNSSEKRQEFHCSPEQFKKSAPVCPQKDRRLPQLPLAAKGPRRHQRLLQSLRYHPPEPPFFPLNRKFPSESDKRL